MYPPLPTVFSRNTPRQAGNMGRDPVISGNKHQSGLAEQETRADPTKRGNQELDRGGTTIPMQEGPSRSERRSIKPSIWFHLVAN